MSVVRLDETNCEVMGVRFDMILLFILYCLVVEVECIYVVVMFLFLMCNILLIVVCLLTLL